MSKKMGGGGEWVEGKGIVCSQYETFYRITFAHERGAIVQETLKDFSQNGKHIDLKPEQKAAIRVYPSLQSIYQILVGVKEKLLQVLSWSAVSSVKWG